MGKRFGFPFLASAVFLFLGIFFTFSCGGGGSGSGGGGGDSVAVSGTLGTGYSTALAAPEAASPLSFSDGVVDQVVALPNYRGVMDADSIDQLKTAPVGTDGTFSLSLANDRNWVLVLEDTQASDLMERFVGYVALKVDTDSSLLSIPFSAVSVDSMDLGAISQSGDTGITDNAASASDFTMTAQQLGTLARTDDLFKSVKNLLVNHDGTTGSFILPMPVFEFSANLSAMDNSFSAPADYSYISYQVLLLPNMPGFTMSSVCGDGVPRIDLSLYPPAGTSVMDTLTKYAYDGTNPITNDYAECSTGSDDAIEASEPSPETPVDGSGDFYASDRQASMGYPVTLEFGRGGGNGLVGDVPSGIWQYEVDGVLKGQFDLAVASPWAGDFINALIPVLRINRDAGTGQISSIDIKWYRPNDSQDGYVELTDLGVLGQLVEFANIEIENYASGRRYENAFIDPSTTNSYTPTNLWYMNGTHPADSTLEAWGVHLSYGSAGVNLFFSNRK